jgi:hypothetical protein
MGKLRTFTEAWRVLTGISAQHNKALRDVKDWATTVSEFLSTYSLNGDYSPDSLSDTIGDMKFDLTAIAYKGRPLIKAARKIKGKQISPLIIKLDESLENLRRVLVNPTMRAAKLNEAVVGLRLSFEGLQNALADIEYL